MDLNDKYNSEVNKKQGNTKEYKEYNQKVKNKSRQELENINNNLMSIFKEIGKLKELKVEDEKVQEKIKSLQEFISNNYYNCTNEVLKGLGQMYASDERFKANIDKAGGEGTAEFVNKAISVYCLNNDNSK